MLVIKGGGGRRLASICDMPDVVDSGMVKAELSRKMVVNYGLL